MKSASVTRTSFAFVSGNKVHVFLNIIVCVFILNLYFYFHIFYFIYRPVISNDTQIKLNRPPQEYFKLVLNILF